MFKKYYVSFVTGQRQNASNIRPKPEMLERVSDVAHQSEDLDNQSDAGRKMVSSVQLTLQSPLSATARLFPSKVTSQSPPQLASDSVKRGEAPILPPVSFMTSVENSSIASPNKVDDQPLYSVPIKKGHSRQKPVSGTAAASSLMSESFKPQIVDAQARSTSDKSDRDFLSSFHPLPDELPANQEASTADFLREEVICEQRSKMSDASLKTLDTSPKNKDEKGLAVESRREVNNHFNSNLDHDVCERNLSDDNIDEFSPGSLKSDVSRGFESSETLLSVNNSEGNDFDHNCDSGIQLDKISDLDRPDLQDVKFADDEDESEMKDSGVFLKQVHIQFYQISVSFLLLHTYALHTYFL